MNQTELIMRRRNVQAFIDADPFILEVTRAVAPVKNTATGGYIAQPDVTLDPQKARIVQNVRRYTAGLVNSEAGEIPNSEYRLVGMHTLDLEPNDKFKWLGENYKVLGIHEARQESTFAAIELLGPDNRGS